MRTRLLLSVVLVTLGVGMFAAPAHAQRQAYRANDFLGFRSVLPPGTKGVFNATELAAFQANGTYPAHANDQLAMYGDLVYATPALTRSEDIGDFFKDASFGVPAGEEERTYSPRAGRDDRPRPGFGVPHIYGTTRSDTMFGAGYVGAEDRLFFMDVLRHAGRAQLSGFAGGANKAMDAEQWESRPTPRRTSSARSTWPTRSTAPRAPQLQQDVSDYVAGINAYITEAGSTRPRCRPSTPRSAAAPGLEGDRLDRDRLAGRRHLRQGRRRASSRTPQVLQAARAERFGADRGTQVWHDFRRAKDPEAPTTVRGPSFPYQVARASDPAAVAMPDPGSLVSAAARRGAQLRRAAASAKSIVAAAAAC